MHSRFRRVRLTYHQAFTGAPSQLVFISTEAGDFGLEVETIFASIGAKVTPGGGSLTTEFFVFWLKFAVLAPIRRTRIQVGSVLI